jgi:hypothetical protein
MNKTIKVNTTTTSTELTFGSFREVGLADLTELLGRVGLTNADFGLPYRKVGVTNASMRALTTLEGVTVEVTYNNNRAISYYIP